MIPPLIELKSDSESHQKLMTVFKQNPDLITAYEDSFNCVDGEDLEIKDIKILHYSDMGTQFSHKYSIPRLRNEGSKHWFDGKVMPHPRQALSDLYDRYYEEALAQGYKLDDYRVEPFGVFPKMQQK